MTAFERDPLLSRKHYWIDCSVIVSVVAIIQLLAASNHPPIYTWDSPSYIEPAQMLACCGRFEAHDPISYSAETGSFPEGPVRAETVRTPVYPALLAIIFKLGGTVRTVVVLQRAVIVLFSLLMYRFVGREFGRAVALLTVFVYAVWPSLIDSTGLVMTEVIASILIASAVGVFYLGRQKRNTALLVVAGLLFGIATLTRPITLYLPVLLTILLVIRRSDGWRAAAAFALAAAVLPLAWAARNEARAGAFVVSSIEGENLLMYRAAGALTVQKVPAWAAVFALQRQFGYHHTAIRMRPMLAREAIAAAERDSIPRAAQTHAVLSRYYTRLAIRTILEHPVAYAELTTSALIELYFEPLATRAAKRGMNPVDAAIALVPVAVVLFALALFGILRLHRTNPDAAILLIVALSYFSVVSAGPEVGDRFLVPFLGLYAFAIAVGVVGLTRLVRINRRNANRTRDR